MNLRLNQWRILKTTIKHQGGSLPNVDKQWMNDIQRGVYKIRESDWLNCYGLFVERIIDRSCFLRKIKFPLTYFKYVLNIAVFQLQSLC